MNKKAVFIISAVVAALSASFQPCASSAQDDKASATAESAAKIDFLTKKDVRLIEAESLIRQEKYVDALILIEDIIRQDVRTDEAYLLAAYSYIKLEKFDKARQTLVNALNLDKRNKAAHNYAGRLALAREEIDDAKDNLAAIRTICGGTDCAEYKDLELRIMQAENPEP